eukprot:278375-Chlamydomonas_euryale.AAC.1
MGHARGRQRGRGPGRRCWGQRRQAQPPLRRQQRRRAACARGGSRLQGGFGVGRQAADQEKRAAGFCIILRMVHPMPTVRPAEASLHVRPGEAGTSLRLPLGPRQHDRHQVAVSFDVGVWGPCVWDCTIRTYRAFAAETPAST